VWALAVGGAGEGLLATGASDATFAVWEDCTVADEEEAAAEEAAIVLKQQDLSNALQVGRQHPLLGSVTAGRVPVLHPATCTLDVMVQAHVVTRA
jgi:hypothetical protein